MCVCECASCVCELAIIRFTYLPTYLYIFISLSLSPCSQLLRSIFFTSLSTSPTLKPFCARAVVARPTLRYLFIHTYIVPSTSSISLPSYSSLSTIFFFFFQVSMWISSIRSCPGHHQLVRISSLLSPPPDDSILNTLVPGGEDVYPSVIVHSPSRSIGDLSKGSLPPNQKAGEARHFDRFKKSIKSLVLSRQAFQKLSYVCTYLEESRPPHPCLPLMCFDGGGGV